MIQREHKAWLEANYPGQAWQFPAAGIVEETGELLHTVVKMAQEKIWKLDSRYDGAKWGDRFRDAIGDCAIYCCSLCNTMDWDFDLMVTEVSLRQQMEVGLSIPAVVELMDYATALFKRVDMPSLFAYMWRLVGIAHAGELDFKEAIRITWEEVRERHNRQRRSL